MFHDEKDQLLQAGLSVSQYIHTDDTGARHDGKNGYCTHIGNELFAWFSSTESKSRINFLSCLSQGSDSFYVLNAGAFAYMEQQKLPLILLVRLELKGEGVCSLRWPLRQISWCVSKPLSIGRNGWISRASKPSGTGESSPKAL
jgi:hypothetical protein